MVWPTRLILAALVYCFAHALLQLVNCGHGGIVQLIDCCTTAPDSIPTRSTRGAWTRVSKCEYGHTSSFLLPPALYIPVQFQWHCMHRLLPAH